MSHASEISAKGFSFEELNDAAKEVARDWWRDCSHEDVWYETVQEDAIKVWALFGFEVVPEQAFFALSYSQGDGASFAGDYRAPEKSVVEAIVEYAPEDKVLKSLAERIDILQTTAQLRWNTFWTAKIIRRGYYEHSGTMRSDEVMLIGEAEADDSAQHCADHEIEVIARSLANWYFERLKEESEYLNSDKCVDEALDGYRFDESGHII